MFGRLNEVHLYAKTACVEMPFSSKLGEHKSIENLIIRGKRDGRISRKSNLLSSAHRRLVANPIRLPRKNVTGVVNCGSKFENSEGKGKTKHSAKWVSYGGCIPSILQALDTVCNLDEAFKPWEESLSKKEISIILKEQSDWGRAAEIFEWFKRKGCYEVNVIHYNIVLRILGKARRWDRIENLWIEMKRRRIMPTNSTFGTLIHVYSKGGLKDEALCWLDEMNKQGMQPDEVTMGIVVQTYKKAGEFEKAEQFFKKWSSSKLLREESGASPNTSPQSHNFYSAYTYNTLIDTYGKAGKLKEASGTFAQMLGEGVVPTTVTFNTMIHICGNHGHFEEATALVAKMEELRCPPDTRTYNILISLHTRNDNIDAATNYFTKMKKVGLIPDLVSFRTLLYAFSIRQMVGEAEALLMEMDERGLEIDEFTHSALTRMYIDAGMVEKSWSWFERYHLKGNLSSDCYSANIDAFGERGHLLLAEKAFFCCLGRKKLSVLEFNVMIKAYGIGKNYDKACDLFDAMVKHGIFPDKFTYNSLIQILSGADLPHRAIFYLRKMQEAGFVDDCIPYCAVISSFVKMGKLGTAEELYKEMVGFGVQPDIIVFGILINAFSEAGSVKEAMDYVGAMKCAGFTGNSIIYNSLIKLYTKVGYLQEAQETYLLLQSSEGDSPDVYSSNCMIDLYSERTMVRQAEEIFEDLKKKGKANEFSHAMMLCMYKKIGRFGEAIEIAREMIELGLLTSILSYNNVIGLYALDGRLKEVVETFHRMIKSGIQPDDSTFRSLRVVMVKSGASKEAFNQLEQARKRDAQSGIHVWMACLCSMVGMDGDDDDEGEEESMMACGKTKWLLEFDPAIENYELESANGSIELKQCFRA